MNAAVYGAVSEIKELRSMQVCRIAIEVPAESYKAVVALLHGQRVLVTIAPELPMPYGVVQPSAEPEPAANDKPGPLCILAVQWCRDDRFQGWLSERWPTLWSELVGAGVDGDELAKRVVCNVCGVESRKELDRLPAAGRAFHTLIRAPYMGRSDEG